MTSRERHLSLVPPAAEEEPRSRTETAREIGRSLINLNPWKLTKEIFSPKPTELSPSIKRQLEELEKSSADPGNP